MNILVTGGAGFIGSHFTNQIINEKDNNVVILDRLTYAADLGRLKDFDGTFIEGDIGDAELVGRIMREYDITHVVNFAAESHVDKSIQCMDAFLQTNVIGTYKLLESVDSYWSGHPKGYEGKLFVHISTDEVYGAIDSTAPPATETSPLKPSNPYASSKAAADQFVLGFIYGKSFPAAIFRSSNNFGKYQDSEKLIPKTIENLRKGVSIPIYGLGTQKRCWLYVGDYCQVLNKLIKMDIKGQIFNVKGPSSLSNLSTVENLRCAYEIHVGKTDSKIEFVTDRKMHDGYYHINDDKITSIVDTKGFTTIEAYIDSGEIFSK